jgi:hypothetical protein
MFGDSDTIATWSFKGILALSGALLVLPVAAGLVLLTALAAAPLAVVGVPFKLLSFFGAANHERHDAQTRRAALPLAPALALQS